MHLRLPALLATLLMLVPAATDVRAADDPIIRVALFSNEAPREVVVRGHEGAMNLFVGDSSTPVERLDEGDAVTISRENDQLRIELGEGTLYALSLGLEPDSAFAVEVTAGRSKIGPLAYGGALHVAPGDHGGLRLVNRIALEQYVASVLGSEYGLDDVEGTKAMAVAIRTYALRSGGKYGSEYDHEDHVMSQHYRGLEYVSPATLAAARATEDEVLTYDGELIEATYFASSGGHTADNETVWESERLPYLRGRPDPYDEVSPYQSWRANVSRARLLNVVGDAVGRPVRGFVLGEHSGDGRVQEIELLHDGGRRTSMQANRFRLLVNQTFGAKTLMSTFFDAERRGSSYVFEGRGFGHGVGLCQWGAHGMAREGHSYRDILAFYYRDVSLGRHDGTAPAPLTPPVAARVEEPRAEPPVDTSRDRRPPPPAPEQASNQMTLRADTVRTAPDQTPPRARRIGW